MKHMNKDISNFLHYCGKLEKEGREIEVVDLLTEKIESCPVESILFFERGSRYEELGKLESALIDYSTAIELSCVDVVYLVARGNLYGKLGMNEEAECDLKAAMSLAPNHPAPHQFLSMLYSYTGKVDEAIRLAKIAIEIAPEDHLSHYAAANSYYFGRKYEIAQDYISAALDLDRSQDHYWSLAGECLFKLNRFFESKQAYGEALKLCESPTYYIKISRACVVLGEFDEAEYNLKEAEKFTLEPRHRKRADKLIQIISKKRISKDKGKRGQ